MLTLPLLLLVISCSNTDTNYHGVADLTRADVKPYSDETQDKAHAELVAAGCLPDKTGTLKGCTIPTLYAWLVDYHKMREQERVAPQTKSE